MSHRRLELLEAAFSQYGIMEVKGQADNPEIIKYFDALGLDGKALKDETSWCGAFVNWCTAQACLPGTGDLSARSWLEVGLPTADPVPGDIVVLWRGEHPDEYIPGTRVKKGHVGFYIRHDAHHVYILGGNQSNMVCISAYPMHQVLSFQSVVK